MNTLSKQSQPGKRAVRVLAALITLITLSAAGQPDELRGKVAQFVDDWLRDAKVESDSPNIKVQFFDLNGAEPPEALVIVESLVTCGARGCSAFVLDLSGPKARSIGHFIGSSLEPLPGHTNGWRDIALDGGRVTFQGGETQEYRVVP